MEAALEALEHHARPRRAAPGRAARRGAGGGGGAQRGPRPPSIPFGRYRHYNLSVRVQAGLPGPRAARRSAGVHARSSGPPRA
jgi:hypothetical protein